MTDELEQAESSTRLRARDNLQYDLPAGLVVFFIALPLCLGIAFASGAPLIAGLISGIVGGLVVAPTSKAALAISGPAAGLFVVVLGAINSLGSYEVFLTAVCLAGLMQIALGYMRAGVIAYYVPSSVIRGMLAGIGVVLLLKQVPHAIGYNADFEGDIFFSQVNGGNTLTGIQYALEHIHFLSAGIAIIGLIILTGWSRVEFLKRLRFLNAPLVVVLLAVAANFVIRVYAPGYSAEAELLVGVPVFDGISGFIAQLQTPNFSAIIDPGVWESAAIIAAVASVETLLCVEAIDKLDPLKRRTPTSHELKAQGLGNLVSGLLGGIPMTGVIVRGSANVHSGARTWFSSFFQGLLLLVTVLAIPGMLNEIPLAALAAILLYVGYKLAPVDLMIKMARQGVDQWLPFLITILGIVFTDLLRGVAVGLAVGVFFVLRNHVSAAYFLHEISTVEEDGHQHVRVALSENVSFLNKAALNKLLHSFPRGAVVELDGRGARHIDRDALEVIHEFIESAPMLEIKVITHGLSKMLVDHGFSATNEAEDETDEPALGGEVQPVPA